MTTCDKIAKWLNVVLFQKVLTGEKLRPSVLKLSPHVQTSFMVFISCRQVSDPHGVTRGEKC